MKNLRIGITGPARAGKDTIARRLEEHHGFIVNRFADPLKRAAQQMFMLTEEQTWGDDLKEVEIAYWGLSPRQMFQRLGTEGGREVFGTDLWLKRWKLHFDTFGPHTNYVTSDVRFENEAAMLRDLGFTIVHVRTDRASNLAANAKKHASEAGVKFDYERDYWLDNSGTFKQLYDHVDALVEMLKEGA